MELSKYSFGTGDRFGRQGSAQLAAIAKAQEQGVEMAIVWNKSHREHSIVGTTPAAVRQEADEAVRTADWNGPYYVDADHINLGNVESFLAPSDFFTIDVAEYIGKPAADEDLESFVAYLADFLGGHEDYLVVAGIDQPLRFGRDRLHIFADKYLFAVQHAAAVYRYIERHKGAGNFITEISMDETTEPQSPEELFVILAAIARNGIPAQTIAPKFTGRFNKGVDYQGDVDRFNREFRDDICVIRRAVADFGLPRELKLSVHSGSDKFSIYPGIRQALLEHDAGVHIKTAGTTWLEELIGLAAAGEEPAMLVKKIYRESHGRFTDLCQPYATVIDIDRQALPDPSIVDGWTPDRLARAIRHDQSCSDYDRNLRQLLHVGYKVAAELGETYHRALQQFDKVVAQNVRDNLFTRHIAPLFL